jgi:hypothetical protein
MHGTDSAVPQLTHERNRLQPVEAFLDSLPLPLADSIASMLRSAGRKPSKPAQCRKDDAQFNWSLVAKRLPDS